MPASSPSPLGAGYLVAVQLAFDTGHVLRVVSPLVALLLGTMTAMSAAYVAEREQRRARRLLQRAPRARGARPDRELRDTQLEVVRRLGRAVESRDADTGFHIDRMSALAERLGLATGMRPEEAELLRHAARAARRRQDRHPRRDPAQAGHGSTRTSGR